MAKKRVEDIVTELTLPIVEKYNFELVDVEYVKEGANWYLRLFIDKPGGITIDDCEMVSREVETRLDEIDPIKHSYILEVSSPGLDRPLKKERDFEKYKGEEIEVKLFKPLNGKKMYTGELLDFVDNKIILIEDDGNTLEFDMKTVAIAKRVIKF